MKIKQTRFRVKSKINLIDSSTESKTAKEAIKLHNLLANSVKVSDSFNNDYLMLIIGTATR
jgi:hypothetical protein